MLRTTGTSHLPPCHLQLTPEQGDVQHAESSSSAALSLPPAGAIQSQPSEPMLRDSDYVFGLVQLDTDTDSADVSNLGNGLFHLPMMFLPVVDTRKNRKHALRRDISFKFGGISVLMVSPIPG